MASRFQGYYLYERKKSFTRKFKTFVTYKYTIITLYYACICIDEKKSRGTAQGQEGFFAYLHLRRFVDTILTHNNRRVINFEY